MKFGIPTLIAVSAIFISIAVAMVQPLAGLYLFGAVIFVGIVFLVFRIITLGK